MLAINHVVSLIFNRLQSAEIHKNKFQSVSVIEISYSHRHYLQSIEISCNQLHSVAISCNQLHSAAISWNQFQKQSAYCKQWCISWHKNTLFFHVIKTELYITWQSSDPMFKEVTWQKFEATIWFKNDLTFWAFDREINQTRIPDPWDHLNIHNESEMNYHEYSDSVQRHVIRLPRDHFSITWSSKILPIFLISAFSLETFLPKRGLDFQVINLILTYFR